MWRSLCKFRIGVIVWSIRFQRCGGLFPSAVGGTQMFLILGYLTFTRSPVLLNADCFFYFLKRKFLLLVFHFDAS